MIPPTAPIYGVFLRALMDAAHPEADLMYLPVVGYSNEGTEVTPHFIAHGSVQSWSVFTLPEYRPLTQYHIVFLGLLIPDSLIPEAGEQQLKMIIANAQQHLQQLQARCPKIVLEATLGSWLGESNGQS